MRICAPRSVSSPRVLGACLCSDGSFEYQFLIENTVYRYFKFTLSAMSIILQCRYFVSVLAHDARYCELQILYAQSRYRSEQKSIKNVGKISCWRSHAGTPKNFQSTHMDYRAHRAVIFAIAWHLVKTFLAQMETEV